MNINDNIKRESIIRYLHCPKSDIQQDMVVTGIGYQFIDPDTHYPMEGHPKEFTFNPKHGRILNEFAIVYITRGKGIFTSVSSGTVQLTAGDLFFITPGQWHSYHPDPDKGWDEYWVTFHGSYYRTLMTLFELDKNNIFHIGLNEHIVRLFHEMKDYSEVQGKGLQLIINGNILHIMGLIYSINKHEIFKEKETQKIHKACIFMHENICKKLKPEDIAESLHMSYSSFRKIFKQYIGIAPHQYMLQLKLEKIKELLSNSDMSIQDIALEMGFESADYFSYFFRSKTGINPLSYRKEIESQREQARRRQK